MLCDHAALVALRREASKASPFFICIANILNKNYKRKHRHIGQMGVCPVINYNKSILGILMKNSQVWDDWCFRKTVCQITECSCETCFWNRNFGKGQRSWTTWCNFPVSISAPMTDAWDILGTWYSCEMLGRSLGFCTLLVCCPSNNQSHSIESLSPRARQHYTASCFIY